MEFVWDALLDSLKVLPFLLVAYVLIEVIEFYSADKVKHVKLLSGKWSTLFASGFGLVPQCGFSVVATDLFASKRIKIGTLLAVYIATSDEAIPILLTTPNKILSILPLLLVKFVLAIIVGYGVDLIFKKQNQKRLSEGLAAANKPQDKALENSPVATAEKQDEGCEHDTHEKHSESLETPVHHGCCGHDIDGEAKKGDLVKRFLLHPLIHSLKIFAFILIVNLALGALMQYVGTEAVTAFLKKAGWFAPLLAALVGLIPNCASSVVLTELYALGALGFGATLAGLIVNAGIAIALLFKQNKNQKENFTIVGGLLLVAIAVGYIIKLIGF